MDPEDPLTYALTCIGWSLNDSKVLTLLLKNGKVTSSDANKAFGMHQAHFSRTCHALTEQGLTTFKQGPSNGNGRPPKVLAFAKKPISILRASERQIRAATKEKQDALAIVAAALI